MSNILITGAAGRIGKIIRSGLTNLSYSLRSCDRIEFEKINNNEEQIIFDISDLNALNNSMHNIDCVIHLAGIPFEDSWEKISAVNINGTYNIFEAARQQGVKKIIFASTNHVIGFYKKDQEINTNVLPRPDTLYGVSKSFGESLGRYYADKFNLSVSCLRIGSFVEKPTEERHLATWLSYRDMVHLVNRCIEAQYHYLIIYGVSANTRNKWDNNAAAKIIGYQPQDNAENFSAEITEKYDNKIANYFHGGTFCSDDFDGDIERIS